MERLVGLKPGVVTTKQTERDFEKHKRMRNMKVKKADLPVEKLLEKKKK